jgi:hypothetical protein
MLTRRGVERTKTIVSRCHGRTPPRRMNVKLRLADEINEVSGKSYFAACDFIGLPQRSDLEVWAQKMSERRRPGEAQRRAGQ